jgi:serine/threonine protein kinase
MPDSRDTLEKLAHSLSAMTDDQPPFMPPVDAPRAPLSPVAERDTTAIAQDQFIILEEHARGGLGKVSLARDVKLRRTVALKEIRPDRSINAGVRQRFLNEAAITGQLEHPGIVPVYSLNEDANGRPYYAMRFIQGRTLTQAIKEWHESPTPLGFRNLLQRFITVC